MSEAQEREAFEAWRRRTTKMDPDGAVALRGLGGDSGYDNTYTRCMHMAWMARAALPSTSAKGDAGEWKLVPVDPTPEMLLFANAVVRNIEADLYPDEIQQVYRAMVAAAPKETP